MLALVSPDERTEAALAASSAHAEDESACPKAAEARETGRIIDKMTRALPGLALPLTPKVEFWAVRRLRARSSHSLWLFIESRCWPESAAVISFLLFTYAQKPVPFSLKGLIRPLRGACLQLLKRTTIPTRLMLPSSCRYWLSALRGRLAVFCVRVFWV